MSSDPQHADAQQQEQMRQYLEQLRAAEPAEIVAQAFTMLGTGAEVKLGRPDARVLIDAIGGLVSAVEGGVPEQLVDGMRSGLAQLQQAQVQAEGQPAGQGDAQVEGQAPPQEPAQPGEAGGTRAEGAAPGQQSGDDRRTDRLWIPGRGQPPSAG